MKVVTITGKRQCELVDRPEPSIRDEFVKIKVTVAPMCTEYKSYVKGDVSDVIGHEAAGEVVEVDKSRRVRVGDRVVLMPLFPCGRCDLCATGNYIYCQNKVNPLRLCASPTGAATYAQYAIKQDWLLLPIPDDLSDAQASMACCGLGPTFGAMQAMQVDAFDTVLIVGLGPVGLGGVINGVFRRARVIGLEPNPYRAQLALDLGAAAVIDPRDPDALAQIRSLTIGRGVDKAVDCTAVPAAQKLAIRTTRVRGHITFVGWGGRIVMGNMVPTGLTLQGSWHWNLRDTARIWQVIHACKDSIDRMITHRFPMRCVKEAWELQVGGQCGKVLLSPWED